MIVDAKQACWKMAAIQFVVIHECLALVSHHMAGKECLKLGDIKKQTNRRAEFVSLRKIWLKTMNQKQYTRLSPVLSHHRRSEID